MKLYIMRHGPAEEHSESGTDHERALTASGRERVRAVAKALVDSQEEPLHVVTSPLVRAVQTAEIVAVVTRLSDREGDVSVRRAISPGGPLLTLTRKLVAEHRRRVMLVGHEPDLSELVSGLMGRPFETPFDKAMVVALHLTSDGEARLRFVLDPKTLRLEPAPAP